MQLKDEVQKQADLQRMKRLASGLFFAVSALFLVTLALQTRYPWIGFLRATAEAAMVGAIADWFAVTALFRHPFGLKIPHTAIVPRRKDNIGESIGRFVANNFLEPRLIATRLRGLNPAYRAGVWMAVPEHASRLSALVAALLESVLQVVNDADVQAVIERRMVAQLRSLPAAPFVGRLLGVLLGGRRQEEVIYGITRLGARVLEENREVIRQKIREESPWWLPHAIDRQISQKVIDTLDETLQEAGTQPDHWLRTRLANMLSRLVADLQQDEVLIARAELFKEDLLHSPILRDVSASLWSDLKRWLLEHGRTPDSELRSAIERWILRFGEVLQQNEVLAQKINYWIEAGAVYLVGEYGHEFSALISHTVKNWDADVTTQKVELQIGKDLQYIRINGTIVGGLAGLLIYLLTELLERLS